jgi:hypothetical protein
MMGSMYMGPKGIEKRSMCLILTIFPEVKEKNKMFHMFQKCNEPSPNKGIGIQRFIYRYEILHQSGKKYEMKNRKRVIG